MPELTNKTDRDLRLWALGNKELKAGESIEVTDKEAELFADHPHIAVRASKKPKATAPETQEDQQ